MADFRRYGIANSSLLLLRVSGCSLAARSGRSLSGSETCSKLFLLKHFPPSEFQNGFELLHFKHLKYSFCGLAARSTARPSGVQNAFKSLHFKAFEALFSFGGPATTSGVRTSGVQNCFTLSYVEAFRACFGGLAARFGPQGRLEFKLAPICNCMLCQAFLSILSVARSGLSLIRSPVRS